MSSGRVLIALALVAFAGAVASANKLPSHHVTKPFHGKHHEHDHDHDHDHEWEHESHHLDNPHHHKHHHFDDEGDEGRFPGFNHHHKNKHHFQHGDGWEQDHHGDHGHKKHHHHHKCLKKSCHQPRKPVRKPDHKHGHKRHNHRPHHFNAQGGASGFAAGGFRDHEAHAAGFEKNTHLGNRHSIEGKKGFFAGQNKGVDADIHHHADIDNSGIHKHQVLNRNKVLIKDQTTGVNDVDGFHNSREESDSAHINAHDNKFIGGGASGKVTNENEFDHNLKGAVAGEETHEGAGIIGGAIGGSVSETF